MFDMPWANTVHGLTPAPAAISNASPIPKINRPKQRKNKVDTLGLKSRGFAELQGTVGIDLSDRNFMRVRLPLPESKVHFSANSENC
jgi:hypothetical protein